VKTSNLTLCKTYKVACRRGFSSALPKIIGTRPVVAFGNERFRPVVACGLWFIPILKVPCISMEYEIDDAERSGGSR
jgi:hypothetical protein